MSIFDSSDARWTVLTTASTVLAAVVVRRAMKGGWRLWKDDDPPRNPAARDVDWVDALAWAGATGAAVAVARVVARRGAAAGWERLTGRAPPL